MPLTLGHIGGHVSDGEFYWLSNAFFGFSLAIIGPEAIEVFRSNVRFSENFGKFWLFWPLEASILT